MIKRIIYAQLLIVLILCFAPKLVWAADTDETTKKLIDEILEYGNYEKIDSYANKSITDNTSFSSLVYAILNDDGTIGKNLGEYVLNIISSEMLEMKGTIRIILIAIIAATIFNKLAIGKSIFVGEMSFLYIYSIMMTFLLVSFDMLGKVVTDGIEDILLFLSAVVPAYASTLVLTGNISTAAIFYSLTFGLIYFLEWGMEIIIMPGIHIYVLLEILNNLYEERRLSRLAELIHKGLISILKAAIGMVIGIGVIQTMINTAKDRVSDSALLHSISVIPGIGKFAGASGEIFLSCAILVKNSVGAAVLIFLLSMGIVPLIKTFVFEISYKVISAFIQPVADKRVVEGLHGIAVAGELYRRVLVCAILLFFIAISIVCMASSFNVS